MENKNGKSGTKPKNKTSLVSDKQEKADKTTGTSAKKSNNTQGERLKSGSGGRCHEDSDKKETHDSKGKKGANDSKGKSKSTTNEKKAQGSKGKGTSSADRKGVGNSVVKEYRSSDRRGTHGRNQKESQGRHFHTSSGRDYRGARGKYPAGLHRKHPEGPYAGHYNAPVPPYLRRRRALSPRDRLMVSLLMMLIIILLLILMRDYAQGGYAPSQGTNDTTDDNLAGKESLEVHFMDVGQGDATLIKCGDEYMLIDAGENEQGTKIQAYLEKMGVEKLDYLVLTHTDSDHIGGADVIVSKFDVEEVFLSDFKKSNRTYDNLMYALEYKKLTHSLPELGRSYSLGDATITFIAPNDTYDDPNESSIALVLEHGENSFLFTGDCEEQAEGDILEAGYDVDCDVYKLGHHGSSTSNSEEFLNAITPEYAVISCEEGNSYGHPHAEPLNRLRAMGTLVFRTDEQGTVIAYSDGAKLIWNCAPSDTWQVGERTK